MRTGCRGFTLVEVVVAVLLVGLLLTGVYGVFGTVSSARDRLEFEGRTYHQARIFFDRIGGELSSLRLSAYGHGRSFDGGATSYGDPYLEFNTELSSPVQQRHGGLVRVRYEIGTDEGVQTLYRSEQVLLVDVPASEQLSFVEGIQNFEVRYYGQGDWHDRWTAGTPPRLVEIAFEMENDSGLMTPFRSSFVLTGGGG